jgi:hypothetical protein
VTAPQAVGSYLKLARFYPTPGGHVLVEVEHRGDFDASALRTLSNSLEWAASAAAEIERWTRVRQNATGEPS